VIGPEKKRLYASECIQYEIETDPAKGGKRFPKSAIGRIDLLLGRMS